MKKKARGGIVFLILIVGLVFGASIGVETGNLVSQADPASDRKTAVATRPPGLGTKPDPANDAERVLSRNAVGRSTL